MIKYNTVLVTIDGKEKARLGTRYVDVVNHRSMKLNDGCKGCNRYWYGCEPEGCPPEQHNKEGQCSRCKRCLECCGHVEVKYSCAWRAAQKTPAQRIRSAAAYERWQNNVNILGHNRRIT